jgi:Tol biopolymer transport system component
MTLRCCSRALPLALGVLSVAATARAEIAFSPDGTRLALSASANNGVMVFDTRSGELSTLTDTPSSGYAFAWSPDGATLGFKVLHAAVDGYLQEPVVYDVGTGSLRSLAAPSPLAGVPSFSANGDVAFTLGHEAIVVAASGQVSRYDLGQYVNLPALSPDGTQLAFNASDDSIWLLDLTSGQRRRVAGGPSYAPSWSPDGRRLLLRGVEGNVTCVDLDRHAVVALGRGMSPAWLPDGEHVIFTSMDVPRGDGRTPPAKVETVRFDGTGRRVLAGTRGYDARLSPDGKTLVHRADVDAVPVVAGKPLRDLVRSRTDLSVTLPSGNLRQWWRLAPVKIDDVPYLHQVYDTPNHFNGHWACNATSAVMTLAYYGAIDTWDTTVDVPSSHVSHYGNYVSEVYTVNGHTLDVGSPDPNGNTAYGGYGYIVKNDWKDTKGYMAEYIEFHGVDSGVDWSPSWDKVIAEIDAKHPFVVLTSITSAGHYIVDIGYHSDQHTAIFNDPYGNKNDGYMNYSGANVQYDWPGYNNGFASLTTVHCFIWSRSTVQPPPDAGPPPEDASPPEDAPALPDVTDEEASTSPDVAEVEDGSTQLDAGSDADTDADTSPSALGLGEEPEACACSSVGASPVRGATSWGVLALALACVLRRRQGAVRAARPCP